MTFAATRIVPRPLNISKNAFVTGLGSTANAYLVYLEPRKRILLLQIMLFFSRLRS